MRSFIAIELPKGVKNGLSRIQEQLKGSAADVRWVHQENIHLTLKFLGEINEKQLEEIKLILEEVAKSHSSFSLKMDSLGAFPKTNFPRVIWVGIEKGKNETQSLAEELEKRMVKLGIPKEDKAFSSHITLGRARSALNRDRLVRGILNLTDSLRNEGIEFPVTKITLFKSTLAPGGPIYEILKEASLKTT